MKSQYVCLSPAKINWFLHITKKRADGYHDLSTLFQFVSLADELIFNPEQSGKINLTGDLSGTSVNDNLVYRAAKLIKPFAQNTHAGVSINIKKVIPQGAGLGGGSSNAASVLLMLNQIWQAHLSIDKLAELGQTLGADVPVFVRGETAFATGTGDILTPANITSQWLVLAIDKKCHISTAKMFAAENLNRSSTIVHPDQYSFANSHNDFEPIARTLYPSVAKTLDWLVEYAPARLTGTGACCFAVCESQQHAQKIADSTPQGLTSYVVQTLPSSPVHKQIMEEFSSLTEPDYS
ncbi:4-(cytidine 5'-diphospho)-2-C-methyl-D-erythritol kinase [Gayadomonas joobiniege]|uniref:4-(cytidine 5'-diphospho)-2-C-methyl-D-erythritol kinase n=1 Tax=Gayadomonas joobiniege TaxID=1234606 RepID=UPI00037C7CA7|nr:4-(cytidine 5'-diphospho)-2-C-methyl-D-erythritol kinase [Gayadomonas joobiniege]